LNIPEQSSIIIQRQASNLPGTPIFRLAIKKAGQETGAPGISKLLTWLCAGMFTHEAIIGPEQAAGRSESDT